jgi:CubicO group peptidase (beta-lactamase class C family)
MRRWCVSMCVLIAGYASAADLPRSTPEAQGVDSAKVLEFVDAVDANVDSLHSVMILRRGHVLAEGWWAPYDAKTRHSLFSLSKSFTSTAVGIAIAEGKLKIDDEVLKFFPDEAPANPSNNLKAMRVSDLLRMSTGNQTEPPRKPDESWVKTFLAHPVPFKPGTHFLYNTSATYMASAIVQKAAGETVLDYLKPRLFDPLGIEGQTWEKSPQGISTGGYGLSIRTEDIAKFGQLFLQKGSWNGKQLVPEAWVEAASARQTSNGSNPTSDWDQGYGYQFWRSRHGYRGDGAFGQYCIVLPEQEAVIAITSGTRDMPSILNLVWERLLPAFTSGKIEAVAETQAKLKRKLKGLTLKTPEDSGTTQDVFGKVYTFQPNDRKLDSLTIERGDKDVGPTIVMKIDGQEQRILCGRQVWRRGQATMGRPAVEQPIAAAGGWENPETFVAKLCFVETPFVQTMRLKFIGSEVHLDAESNVGFGRTKLPTLVGKMGK